MRRLIAIEHDEGGRPVAPVQCPSHLITDEQREALERGEDVIVITATGKRVDVRPSR